GLEVGEVEAEALVEEARVEAELQLRGGPRAELRVALVVGAEGGRGAPADRLPGTNGVERARGAAGLPVRGAQLHRPPGLVPERLLGEDPRAADLGVHLQAEVV